MRKLLIIFIIGITYIQIYAQENVFVLVDVSRSITRSQLEDAKQALTEVLLGSHLSNAFVSQGNVQDLSNFELRVHDKVAIVKFGDIQTTVNINPIPIQIQTLPGDIYRIMNSFPIDPTDNKTYITLAKAKIAEYAIRNQILEYKLYLVSDNIQDDYGPNGIPNYPNDYTKNLAEGYNTTNNPVIESPFTKITFSTTSFFTLSFSSRFDVSSYVLPTGSGGVQISPLRIELTSLNGGTNQKPITLKENKFTISWFCTNAPISAQYQVRLSPINQTREKAQIHTTSTNSYGFKNTSDGKWKITVSPANFLASSANTTIEVKSHNSMWLLWLLLISGIFGGGYWFWKKKQEEKLKRLNSLSNVEGFSSGSSINSNPDYF